MGIAERKAREKELRQEQILEAAYEVFRQVGYASATVDQIAERAELAKGTIYLYFKSKEELYFSLLVNGLDILVDLLAGTLREPPPPERFFAQTARTLFQFYRDHTDYFRIFMTMRQEEMQARLPPDLARRINKRATEILKLLAENVRAGIDAGAYLEADPWQVANVMWGAFTGITQLALTKEQLNVRARQIDELLSLCFDLIHKGIRAPAAPGRGDTSSQTSPHSSQGKVPGARGHEPR